MLSKRIAGRIDARCATPKPFNIAPHCPTATNTFPQTARTHDGNAGGLFERMLNIEGVTVAVASFGRHDVIKKAIRTCKRSLSIVSRRHDHLDVFVEPLPGT